MVLSSEEKRCQERFSTRGKIWRIMLKNYFSRKYLEKSDILLIFARRISNNNINPQNLYNKKQKVKRN